MGLLAYFGDVPGYVVALAIMAAPGIVLWSQGQARLFWRMNRQTIARSRNVIRDWLEKTNLSVENSPSPLGHWRYVVRSGTRPVSVYVPREDPELLYLGINLHIPPGDYSAMDSITADQASNMLSDIKAEFVRLGVEYGGVQHPLRAISLTTTMAFDYTVTRPSFLDRVAFMVRAQVLLHLLIEKEANERGLNLVMMQTTPPTTASCPSAPS